MIPKRKACNRGHPYKKGSYTVTKKGARLCKECKKIRARKYAAKNQESIRQQRRKHYEENREEIKAKSRDYRRKNGAKIKAQRLARKYGITPEGRKSLLQKQGGTCAICGKKPGGRHGTLSVDHSHTTGEVRGLLCDKCNLLLGLSGDSAAVLRAAAKYINGR
jgi:predicted transcriptional regulator